MVTVKDNGDAKDGAQASAPASPPPTYAQVAAARPKPAQQPSQPTPPPASTPAQRPPQPQYAEAAYGLPGPASPPHRTFGPTPLPTVTDTIAILPYFDPRSEWALREAASRAKRRFFGALLWGLLVWLVIGSIIGSTVGETARRRRHGSWAVA